MSGPSYNPADYRARDLIPVQRALISVSDKSGLEELGGALIDVGAEIVSTGSTAAALRSFGFAVTEVAEVTGSPEILGGRVKTLHPSIHGGILADLRLAEHEKQLSELGIAAFDLVVVNLYPFKATVAAGGSEADIIEKIDVGGPAMVRGAAKNFANVAVIVTPTRYPEVIEHIRSGGTTYAQRNGYAREAFAHTAQYDSAIAAWMNRSSDYFPSDFTWVWERVSTLRYGENSHQGAALYTSKASEDSDSSADSDGTITGGIAQAKLLGGKEMSYNNWVDADAAVRSAYDFDMPAVAIIKHANPCGIAVSSKSPESAIADAHRRAHECDPTSAFGGVIAANREVSAAMAERIADIFTEVLVAPSFAPGALAVLTAKKNLRLLQLPERLVFDRHEFKQISGGLLSQEPDRQFATPETWTLVSGEPADSATLTDLAFAWKACRAVKSNGILLAHNGATVGIGMGQVNRVDSCHLAVSRAGERSRGAVAASDAFFPFADGLQILLNAGVCAIVQPGGSVRDEEVIAAAKATNTTMYFTGERHFAH